MDDSDGMNLTLDSIKLSNIEVVTRLGIPAAKSGPQPPLRYLRRSRSRSHCAPLVCMNVNGYHEGVSSAYAERGCCMCGAVAAVASSGEAAIQCVE